MIESGITSKQHRRFVQGDSACEVLFSTWSNEVCLRDTVGDGEQFDEVCDVEDMERVCGESDKC